MIFFQIIKYKMPFFNGVNVLLLKRCEYKQGKWKYCYREHKMLIPFKYWYSYYALSKNMGYVCILSIAGHSENEALQSIKGN